MTKESGETSRWNQFKYWLVVGLLGLVAVFFIPFVVKAFEFKGDSRELVAEMKGAISSNTTALTEVKVAINDLRKSNESLRVDIAGIMTLRQRFIDLEQRITKTEDRILEVERKLPR